MAMKTKFSYYDMISVFLTYLVPIVQIISLRMKTREGLQPEFGISKTLDAFKQPPCQPPKGKDVLERYYGVLHSQPPNEKDANAALLVVAKELRALWEMGDARIPLKKNFDIKADLIRFRENLRYLTNKSKKGRPTYVAKVNINFSICIGPYNFPKK